MARDMDWFSEFPDIDDKNILEWLKNATPFLSYNANVGFALCEEIDRREKLMKDMSGNVTSWSDEWINTLELLKNIRGKKWERSRR